MNYSDLISQVLMIIGVLVIFVNVVTEVTKQVVDFKTAKNVNIYVTALSIIFTLITFIAYFQIKRLVISWYLIIAFVVIGFMVAYSAMFGYDKLLKYFDR